MTAPDNHKPADSDNTAALRAAMTELRSECEALAGMRRPSRVPTVIVSALCGAAIALAAGFAFFSQRTDTDNRLDISEANCTKLAASLQSLQSDTDKRLSDFSRTVADSAQHLTQTADAQTARVADAEKRINARLGEIALGWPAMATAAKADVLSWVRADLAAGEALTVNELRTKAVVVSADASATLASSSKNSIALCCSPKSGAPSMLVIGADPKFPRLQLGLSDDGAPRVRLYNTAGERVAAFALDKEDRPLLCYYQKDEARMTLNLHGETGRPSLTYYAPGNPNDPVATFSLSKAHRPGIYFDDAGKGRMMLALADAGGEPIIRLKDNQDQAVLDLGVATTQRPTLQLLAAGKMRAYFGLDGKTGNPSLEYCNPEGTLVSSLEINNPGKPGLYFIEGKTTRLSLELTKDFGTGTLRYYDANGRQQTELGIAKIGQPMLVMGDNGVERMAIGLATKLALPYVRCYTPEGYRLSEFGVSPLGRPVLSYFDGTKEAKSLLGLSLTGTTNQPLLSFDGADEKHVLELGVYNGAPGMRLQVAGNTRASFSLSTDGLGTVALYTTEGNPAGVFGVAKDQHPALAFYDAGKKRLSLALAQEDGGPLVRFMDAAGDINMNLSATGENGRPLLELLDSKKVRLALGLGKTAADPLLMYFTSGGSKVAEFSASTTGNPGLFYYGEDGKRRLGLGLASNTGFGVLNLLNAEGETACTLGLNKDGLGGLTLSQNKVNRISLAMWDAGEAPRLKFRTPEGKTAAEFGLADDRHARLSFKPMADDTNSLDLGYPDGDTPAFRLFAAAKDPPKIITVP